MKKIVMVAAAAVDGSVRYPSEGVIETNPAEADRCIAAGIAIADDLDSLKVDDLRGLTVREHVAIGPTAAKPEIIDAIRRRRANLA